MSRHIGSTSLRRAAQAREESREQREESREHRADAALLWGSHGVRIAAQMRGDARREAGALAPLQGTFHSAVPPFPGPCRLARGG